MIVNLRDAIMESNRLCESEENSIILNDKEYEFGKTYKSNNGTNWTLTDDRSEAFKLSDKFTKDCLYDEYTSGCFDSDFLDYTWEPNTYQDAFCSVQGDAFMDAFWDLWGHFDWGGGVAPDGTYWEFSNGESIMHPTRRDAVASMIMYNNEQEEDEFKLDPKLINQEIEKF